jgi:hypothetical protein
LHPGALVATAVLVDCVPIVDGHERVKPTTAHAATLSTEHGLRLCVYDPERGRYDYTGQLPLGDFTPGRWAWLLEDVRRTVDECPACGGQGFYGLGTDAWNCRVCTGRGSCAPIPWKGRQGVWEWAA